MPFTLRHLAEQSRYELLEDDRVAAFADCRLRGGAMVIHHTEVLPHMRGHGVGAELVHRMLDDIKASGGKVEPACSFVRQYMDSHIEYATLRA